MSGSFAGAVITTFFAPACRCLDEVSLSRKIPVDSTTMSTPISPHGSAAGILHGADPDLAAVDEDRLALGRDLGVERAVHRVVLEQVRERLGVGEVIDGHDLHVTRLEGRPKEHAADPSEPIDSDPHTHAGLPFA